MADLDVFVCTRPMAVIESSPRIRDDGMALDPSCSRWIVDADNAYALEAALQLREQGAVARVVCISAGPVEYDLALTWCLAAGADRVLRVDLPTAGALDARATGVLLAGAVRRAGGSLVIMAQRSGDEQNALVAPAMAADLGAGYLDNAVDVRVEAGEVRIQRRIERGHRQLWAADLPAVVAVAPGANRPRYVSVAGLSLARQGTIEILTSTDPDKLPRLSERVSLVPGRQRTRAVSVPAASASAAERMQAIMGTASKGPGPTMLRGSKEELADHAVAFMQDRGILRPGPD